MYCHKFLGRIIFFFFFRLLPSRVATADFPSPFGPTLCQYLSEETLKAVGPFYLVSMPGEVKDPTQGVNV